MITISLMICLIVYKLGFSIENNVGGTKNIFYTFFYKNLVYKDIKASNSPKFKNISRTDECFKSWEKNFAWGNI